MGQCYSQRGCESSSNGVVLTHLAVCVGRIIVVVEQSQHDTGDEAEQRQKHCDHR